MAEKLYPPIIPGTLPAFYTDGTVTNITVPFSMNKAVNTNEISGFSLKIKTAYSNTFIGTLEYPKVINGERESLDLETFSLNQIVFKDQDITSLNIKPGQFLKVQLAYIDIYGITGYYSTVGIIKYTDKPTLTISEFEFENNSNEDDSNTIRAFYSTCTGVYTSGEKDTSERPYQYQFLLYNFQNQIIENSGWLLHNNEQDIGDIYTFRSKIDTLTIYQIQYNVKTINNLEVSSKKYKCLIPKEEINNPLILKAENIYEEGYINLSFSKKNPSSILNDISYIIDIYREEYGTNNQYLICKTEFKNESDILKWNFQDFTIEQGISYLYYFKYNTDGFQSQMCGDENENPVEVIADFEDMFLYDGQKQIKLRFNPKVSSFKINHLEQKTDVIGNRYPIFFRNSIVEYKEFPISGLISYHLDDNELFIQDSLQELGIQIKDSFERQNNPAEGFNYPTKSLNLISNNIKAERLFKMKLLDWLGNGETKLFKSPSEGNYLVRLMNISLSPEDKLNRMLHTFSCTAYEVKEFNFENLENLEFININQGHQDKDSKKVIISGPIVGKDNITSLIKNDPDKNKFQIHKKKLKQINLQNKHYKWINDIIKNNKQKDILYEITYEDELDKEYKYFNGEVVAESPDPGSNNIYYFQIDPGNGQWISISLDNKDFYEENEEITNNSITLTKENICVLGIGVYIEYQE